MNAPLLHSQPEAAKALRVSLSTVERLIRRGDLPAIKIGNRRLIPRTALEEYVARLSK